MRIYADRGVQEYRATGRFITRHARYAYVTLLLTALARNLHIHICKWRGASVEPIDQPCISRQNGKYTSVNVVRSIKFLDIPRDVRPRRSN